MTTKAQYHVGDEIVLGQGWALMPRSEIDGDGDTLTARIYPLKMGTRGTVRAVEGDLVTLAIGGLLVTVRVAGLPLHAHITPRSGPAVN